MKRFLVLPLIMAVAACVVRPVYSSPTVPQPYPYPPAPQYSPPPAADAYGYAPPPQVQAQSDLAETGAEPPEPVVSVYVDPPTEEPEPIGVPWAPPPMLVEDPGPPPFYGAIWTGGYWVWDGQWVWAAGRWMAPPYDGYAWTPPYYEHRDEIVVFVPGYWRAPGAVFIAPGFGMAITIVQVRPDAPRGHRCDGPNGVFVPAPPGSRAGIIVPAPVGTNPAVVIGAPPLARHGMQIHPGDSGHVRIDAPADATFNQRAVHSLAPREAHLAAAQPPVVRVAAPAPAMSAPIPTFSPRHGFTERLPPARAPQRLQHAPASAVREPQRPALAPPVALPHVQNPTAPQRLEMAPREPRPEPQRMENFAPPAPPAQRTPAPVVPAPQRMDAAPPPAVREPQHLERAPARVAPPAQPSGFAPGGAPKAAAPAPARAPEPAKAVPKSTEHEGTERERHN